MIELVDDADKCVIIFGGVYGGFGFKESPYEFMRTTKNEPYSRIYLRDSTGSFYQQGVPGLATSPKDITKKLRRIIKKNGFTTVTTVGNCLGGHAALYQGARLNADVVHAFSPAIYLGIDDRIRDFDTRAPLATLKSIVKRVDRSALNVTKYVEKASSTQFIVHYSPGNRIDNIHAKLIDHFPHVKLFEYPGQDHKLALRLRNCDMLLPIIRTGSVEEVEPLYKKARKKVKSSV